MEMAPLDYGPVLLRMPFGSRLAADTLPSGCPCGQSATVGASPWLYPSFPTSCPYRVLHGCVPQPTRHYPRLWIHRPSFGRPRDLNPPDQNAAQHTLRGLRRRGARARQAIPLSRSVDVRARRRCPVRSLERPRWPPFTGRKVPMAAQFCHREPVTRRWTWWSGGHVITTGGWGSGDQAFTVSRGSRGATAVHAFGRPPLYWHAAVPPGFRRRVSR
jgi:hypothetical protein